MPKNIINDGLKIVKALFSWKFGKGYIDVYSRYRPSTGILALLVAINENEAINFWQTKYQDIKPVNQYKTLDLNLL